MNTCPHCQRTLLSHLSERCNWCGEMIPDEAYQQRAQADREAFFLHERLEQAIETARINAIVVDPSAGYMPVMRPRIPTMDPYFVPPPTVHPAPPAPPVENTGETETPDSPTSAQDESQSRFDRLEL